MDNNKNIPEQIYDIICDAVKSMDLEGLSEQLSDAFHRAGEPIREVIDDLAGDLKKNTKRVMGTGYEKAKYGYDRKKYRDIHKNAHIIDPEENTQPMPAGTLRCLPGIYSGPLCSVFGAAGLAGFGPAVLIGYAGALFGGAFRIAGIIGASLMLPFALGSVYLIARGVSSIKRVNRIRDYLPLWRGKSYVMLEDLHDKTQTSVKQIRQDIRYLLEKQAFRFGRLDSTETCLMLTKEAFDQYQETLKAQEEQRKEEKEREKARENFDAASEEEKAFLLFQEQSSGYYNELSRYRKSLFDAGMALKLEEFIGLYSRLLVAVNEDHTKCKKLSNLNDYYIPSVLKLLSVYDEIERKSFTGKSVTETRREIEKSMDMMNEAMKKMNEDLFFDTAMDVSADVRVLEMLLKKDGWL